MLPLYIQVFYPVILLYMVAAFLQGGTAVSMGLLNNVRSFLFIRVSQDAYRQAHLVQSEYKGSSCHDKAGVLTHYPGVINIKDTVSTHGRQLVCASLTAAVRACGPCCDNYLCPMQEDKRGALLSHPPLGSQIPPHAEDGGDHTAAGQGNIRHTECSVYSGVQHWTQRF